MGKRAGKRQSKRLLVNGEVNEGKRTLDNILILLINSSKGKVNSFYQARIVYLPPLWG